MSADYYGYVLNIDSTGNMIWQKLFPSTEFKNYEGVVELNNGFYLSGDVMDAIIDTQHVLLTKINYSGDIEWEKRYTVLGRGGNAKKIVKLPGRLLIAGTTTDSLPSGKGYFIITDTNGSQTTTKVFHYPKNERLSDAIVINSNKLLFTLVRDSTDILSITRVLLTDTAGNILQERFFVPPQREGYIFFESMMEANNGDFIFGGYSQLDTNISHEDVYIARTDSLLYAPPIGILSQNTNLLEQFELYQNFPNPFNPTTTISYEIPKDVNVSIKIYDLLGREVFSLSEFKRTGSYEFQFDGSYFASGIYFFTLEADGYIDTKKMVLLK